MSATLKPFRVEKVTGKKTQELQAYKSRSDAEGYAKLMQQKFPQFVYVVNYRV